MNPEEQRIAIAKACGWQDFKIAEKIGRIMTKTVLSTNDAERAKSKKRAARGQADWPYVEIPDYPNDLNAMHEAEKVLGGPSDFRWCGYCTFLQDVCGEMKSRIHASAPQRAEAFLKTLNLWAV